MLMNYVATILDCNLHLYTFRLDLLFQSGEKDPFEKRFTRCEMDKVIREKNMYKEKYLELQEDLRYFTTAFCNL